MEYGDGAIFVRRGLKKFSAGKTLFMFRREAAMESPARGAEKRGV